MKKARVFLTALFCVAMVTGLLGLSACDGGESGSGGVAATVNGTEIMEQEITEAIEAMRSQNEAYADDASWAQALASSGLTPEELRKTVIESKAQDIALMQAAEEKGYTVDQESVDAQIEQTKATIGAEDEETWIETLQSYGYKDEAAYRHILEVNDLIMQLSEGFEVEEDEEALREYIAANPTIVEGYNAVTGEATTPSAEAPAEGDATVETPAEGETISAAEIDLNAIPEDILTRFKELWAESVRDTAFAEWSGELIGSADIIINEMPEDVSYNVDMSLASTDTEEDTGEATTSSFSSEEAVADAVSKGLAIEDTTVGDGDVAQDGDTVKVLYSGTLEDGTVFDSTADRGNEPFEFTLGSGEVIRGWDAGVVGMQVGGKRLLTIPAPLAYGEQENGSIPANSTLIFEVGLVEVTRAQ